MVKYLESELRRCLILERFDFRFIKFDRLAALHADHVVVMLVIVQVFVSCDAVGEVDRPGEAAIGQNRHGAVHGCIADARIFLAHHPINILGAAMPFVLQKDVEDELPVWRQLQLVTLQVFHKNLHLGRESLHWFTLRCGLACRQQFDNVVVENDDGQHQEKNETRLNDPFFHAQAEIAAHQRLNHQQQDHTAIQNRYR